MMNSVKPESSVRVSAWPRLGCGVGLRPQHFPDILDRWPAMDWFEAVTENYMDSEGRPLTVLERVRERYPVGLHGVALSVGSTDELSGRYLDRLEKLVRRIEPAIVSDHLCWTGVGGQNLHDLLPLPFTEEAVGFIAGRAARVQDRIGRRLLLENISSYVTYRHSTMPEWEFLVAVAKRSGCGILLDLNNVYVNASNHGFDPMDYLRAVPPELVGQFHLGGHTDKGPFLFDTHSAAVVEGVWKLYREALGLYGPVCTLIEWDENIPDFPRLAEEAESARRIYNSPHSPPLYKRGGESLHEKPPPLFIKEGGTGGVQTAPRLRETQLMMRDRILLRRGGRALDTALHPQGGAPGGERMAVYADAYVARITEALKEVFETVEHLTGREAFIDLCGGYVEAYPSGEYNLTDIGRLFPEYAAKSPYAEKLPFLGDLASLEWAISRAFHAPWKTPADLAPSAGRGEAEWERSRLRLQEGCTIAASPWPILDLWNARKTPLDRIDIALEGRPQSAFVHRAGLDVRVRLVSEAEAGFLRRILSGQSIGTVCSAAVEEFGGEPPLGEWFSALSRDGVVTGIEG